MKNDEIAMMAIRDCHAKNIDSFVLDNSNGSLTREFIARGGHKLNSHNMAVGIHDHKYNVELEFVSGYPLINVIYSVVPTYVGEYCELFNKWEYSSFINGKSEVTKVGKEYLVVSKVDALRKPGDTIFIHRDALHTVYSVGPCRWVAREGIALKDKTTLYTRSDNIDVTGLYNRFSSADEVVNYYKKTLEEQGL